MIGRFFAWLSGASDLEYELRSLKGSHERLREDFYELRREHWKLLEYMNLEWKDQPHRVLKAKT